MNPQYTVFALVDKNGLILDINSSAFLKNTNWIEIDAGDGEKYRDAQQKYLDGDIFTSDGIPRYKLVDGKPVLRSEEEIKADILPSLREAKHAEISAASEAAIYAGMDVETTQGTEHFSLTEKDQINLTTAKNAVDKGAAAYPYHADGEMCRIFTAAEINAIGQASISHKIYHTTYCNHLFEWIRRADAAELAGITYGAELPDDLAAHMQEILTQAGAVAETGAVT